MEVKYPILEWRMGIRQFGISDLGCPRMEEVLRAPAAHGVSSILLREALFTSESVKLGDVRSFVRSCVRPSG